MFRWQHRAGRKPRGGARIVRRQVHERPLATERPDIGECPARDSRIRTDAIDLPGNQQILVVAGVAREQKRWLTQDQHGYVMRCVTWRGDDEDVAARRQRHRLLERADAPTIEADEFRLPPFWPTVRQVAHDARGHPAGALELA